MRQIQNPKIKEEFEKVKEHIPQYFYEIPASSTGKYHPAYTQGKGGLIKHTIAACRIWSDLCELEMYNLTEDEKDYGLCALGLHDTVKKGINEDTYTSFEHPLLASKLVREYASQEFADNVCPLIESHMGQWNTSSYSNIVLPKPETKMQQLVHLCDYLASRKYLEWTGEV